jgi:AraC-like DNA-binding protein
VQGSTEIPLVRLSLLLPLVEGLERLGLDSAPVLGGLGLEPSDVADAAKFVPSRTMYSLVESLAEASGDPYFGAHEGERLDPWSWAPLASAATAAATVGDFLLRFSLAASEDASSITYTLETAGPRSRFSGRRVTDAGVRPRHNDGFSIAYVLSIIRPAVGDAWQGSRVVARVCDPSVIPPGYLGIRAAQTDTLGFNLEFPTEWLLRTPQLAGRQAAVEPRRIGSVPAGNLVETLREMLSLQLDDPGLGADAIARQFGFSRRTLMRRLQGQGESFAAMLAQLRRSRAEELLRDADLKVAEVGRRVGYPDPAVFSRAFNRWTGYTPSEFRGRDGAGARSLEDDS